jgi:multicomponent Na+:H+ antiporter subunit G
VSALLHYASWVLLVAGGVFCVIGGVGLLRMPDAYTRMHAASVTDTVGAALILAGLALQAGLTLVTAKLVVLGLLAFFAGPAATHALAKAAMARGVQPLLAPEEPRSSKP